MAADCAPHFDSRLVSCFVFSSFILTPITLGNVIGCLGAVLVTAIVADLQHTRPLRFAFHTSFLLFFSFVSVSAFCCVPGDQVSPFLISVEESGNRGPQTHAHTTNNNKKKESARLILRKSGYYKNSAEVRGNERRTKLLSVVPV